MKRTRFGYWLKARPHQPIPFPCEEDNLTAVQMRYSKLYDYVPLKVVRIKQKEG